jgi:hypothetical protein
MPISDARRLYNREYQERTHRVAVTLNDREYSEFEKRAKNENVRVTTLVKNMALAYHQGQAIIPEALQAELQELRFLLRNVANNINQIAHHSNTMKVLVDENGLLLELQKMEKAVYDYVNRKIQPHTPNQKTPP